MFNKKRLFVAGAFIIALLFMTMYAGGSGEQETTAMRIVKFIDGFNNAEISSQNIEVGGDAEVPTDPKHADLLFIGWYDGDTRVTKFENIMEDLTVISRYVDDINNNGTADSDETPFIVTFYDTVSESNIGVVNVLEGLSATPPAAPEHSGHTFTGWSRSYTNVTSNITVDALYESNEDLADVTRHTVRFLADGEEISTQEIVNEATASEPSETVIPKKEKQVFIGWDKSFDNVTSDLIVNAVYAADINENSLDDATETRYTVIFEADDNGTLEGTTEFADLLIDLTLKDNNVTIPTPVENAGFTFIEWIEETPLETTEVKGNRTYTAVFKDINAPEVEVSNPVEGDFNPESFSYTASDENGLKSMSYTIWTKGKKVLKQSGGNTFKGTKEKAETYIIKELPDGEYELRVSVKDLADNYNHLLPIYFEIDKTSPIASIVSPTKDGLVLKDNITITGEVDSIETNMNHHWFEITTPTGEMYYERLFGTTALKHSFDLDTSYGDGEYRIRYVATDKVGNRSDAPNFSNSTIRTIIVDNTSPIASIVSPAKDGLVLKNDITITGEVDPSEANMKRHWFEITAPNGKIYYEGPIDNEDLTHSFDLDTSYGDGEYRIRYVATDKAGNRSDAPNFSNSTIRTIIVDNTSPIASIVSPAKDGINFGKKVIITGEVDPSEVNMKRHWFEITTPTGGTYYEGPIDNESLTHSFDLDTSYGIGEYKIRYVATDKAGNRSDAPNFSNSTIRTLNVVDINDPETTIEVTPISNGNNFTVKGIAKDDQKLNRVYVQLVNRTTGDRCGGTTIHLLTSLNPKEAEWSKTFYLPEMKLDSNCNSTGYYAAHVEAADNLGNRGSAGWTEDFYLDFTNPTTTLEISDVVNGEFTITGTAEDNYGLNYGYLQLVNRETNKYCGNTLYLTGTSHNWSKTFNLSSLGECATTGEFAAHISITDQFGNSGTVGWTENFYIDLTAPTATILKNAVNEKGNVIAILTASEPIQDIEDWTRVDEKTFTYEFTEDFNDTITFKDLAGNPGETPLVIDNINPKFTNIKYSYTKILKIPYRVTITFDQLVTSTDFSIPRISDIREDWYNGEYYSNKWYSDTLTSRDITFKNKYGKTVTVSIDGIFDQSNTTIETESNSMFSTEEEITNFETSQSRIPSIEEFSETDNIIEEKKSDLIEETIFDVVLTYDENKVIATGTEEFTIPGWLCGDNICSTDNDITTSIVTATSITGQLKILNVENNIEVESEVNSEINSEVIIPKEEDLVLE